MHIVYVPQEYRTGMSVSQEGKRFDSPSKEVSDIDVIDVDADLLSDSGEGGDCNYDNEGELDYDELMETEHTTTTGTGGTQVRVVHVRYNTYAYKWKCYENVLFSSHRSKVKKLKKMRSQSMPQMILKKERCHLMKRER